MGGKEDDLNGAIIDESVNNELIADNVQQSDENINDDGGVIQEGEAEEFVSVLIGDELVNDDDESDPQELAKKLREANLEKEKRIQELEEKLNAGKAANADNAPKPVPKKPTLEDFDYDAEAYETALESWMLEKRKLAELADAEKNAENAQKLAWQEKIDGYNKAKAALRVRDYDSAEDVAREVFNVTQQGIVLQGADNPALVIYALGKNKTKANELAKISDPVKFAFAIAKLEKDLKVTNKKPPPAEKQVIGNGGIKSGAVDSTLERLRAEAEKTGNYTKVIRYKAQKKSVK